MRIENHYVKARALNRAPTVILLVLSMLVLVSCDSGIFSNANWQLSGLQKQPLRVLQVSPKDPDILYAGTMQGHIFVSTNAGQRWTEQSRGLPLPDPLYVLSFDTSGQKLYAATAKGLFMEAGDTKVWSSVTAPGLPATDITVLAFLATVPRVVYAGTSHQGIFVSNNGGTSWQAANSGLPQGIDVKSLFFDPVQNQLWAATSAGAYRSDNRGSSWQSFNAGIPSTTMVNTIVSAAAIGGALGTVYMGTNHGILLSQDSGSHWKANAESLSGATIYQILPDFRVTNGSSIYIATSLGAFRSTDAGQNWQSIAPGLPGGVPIYALIIGAADNTQLYAATNDGLYEFPGTGSSADPMRIITYIVVAAFFFLLYRLGTRGRRPRRNRLKPEHIQEVSSSTPPDDSASPA